MEKELMRTNNMKIETFKVGLVGLLLLVVGYAGASLAQESQPRTFSSPEEAAHTLFEAAQKEDEPALEAMLGAGREVTSSSDEVEDQLEREQFSKKYKEMHRLVREADGSTVLYIGAENWPFPIPLVSKNGAWSFDSETGTQEILFRRIGENEAATIQVCEEFAIAKKEQEAKPPSYDPITQFAQNLVSAGKTNADSNDSSPFHGYHFRLVNGNSAAGTKVALVAYPANYRSSGVKTFIVSRHGVVYERDLGPDTATVAPSIKARSSSWHVAE
jgi:Protein of unknown function (DUF2950)